MSTSFGLFCSQSLTDRKNPTFLLSWVSSELCGIVGIPKKFAEWFDLCGKEFPKTFLLSNFYNCRSSESGWMSNNNSPSLYATVTHYFWQHLSFFTKALLKKRTKSFKDWTEPVVRCKHKTMYHVVILLYRVESSLCSTCLNNQKNKFHQCKMLQLYFLFCQLGCSPLLVIYFVYFS